ncbi:hypothetical protein GALL_134450 [mine drainage metagenome]|uniref:Uncharacterized protein n=1 Tax=mine drainage metagenome TaxID=410659 RepID=A0A1J5SK68_9ZZZZ
MKNIKITVTLSMEVPDYWLVVENANGIDVIDIGDGRYLDFTFTPTLVNDGFKHAERESNDQFTNSGSEIVSEYDAMMKILTTR